MEQSGSSTASDAPSEVPTARHEDLLHQLQRNAWYLATRDKQARLFVTSLGQGPRVVVLHGGWGMNFLYMVGLVEPHLDAREFVLFDQRGSLLSPSPKTEELSVAKLVDDLEWLRQALGEEQLVLVAHSMGTLLAYEYARIYPDRVRSLILLGALGPSSPADTEGFWKDVDDRANAMVERPEVKALLKQEGVAGVSDNAIDRLSTLRWRIVFASVNLARVDRWRSMEGGRVFYSNAAGEQLRSTAPSSWDLPGFLDSRRIPISVIQGDNDYVEPGASSWRAFKAKGGPLADCTDVAVIPRAGHALWVDDPGAVADALRLALSRDRCPM